MTGAWAAMAGAALAVAAQSPVPKEVIVGDRVRVLAPVLRSNFQTGVSEFADGVTIYYGPTKITAERATFNGREKTGKASGNVIITDPEGTVQATDVDLNWAEGSRKATAENVFIEAAGARLRAKSAVLTEELWVFNDVEGTTCRKDAPIYSVRSPRLEVRPGRSGQVINPRLSIFGRQIVTLPTQRFNLDPRVQGIRFPNIAYRRNQGLGVAWNGQFLVNNQTAAGFDFGSFQGGYPTYSFAVSRSFLPPEKSPALIIPRDDLGDRFNIGYFDNVELDGPDSGFQRLSIPRSTLALQTQFNRGAVIGPSYLSYSKALDLTYEAGRQIGPFGGLGQIRLQNIRTQNSKAISRATVGGTLQSKVLPLSRQVGLLGTVDAQGWLGGNPYSWARGTAGVVYQPVRELTLGAGGFYGQDFGRFDFPADNLYSKTGYALRADLAFGGFRGRYLVKYDTRLKWYDREYSVNQVVGCLELFLVYRQFPQNYQIGVTLRTDQFFGLLQRRKFERTKPVSPAAP